MSTPRLLRTSADAKPSRPVFVRAAARVRGGGLGPSLERRVPRRGTSTAPGELSSACSCARRCAPRLLTPALTRGTLVCGSSVTGRCRGGRRRLAISAWSESIRRCLSRQSRRAVARSAASSRTACASRSRSTASPAFSPVLTAALCRKRPWTRVGGGGTTRWAISGDCDSQHNGPQPFKGIRCTTRW